MTFDQTFGPSHAAGERWSAGWAFGSGTRDNLGNVSARSSSTLVGSNFDGAGVGFVINITNERQLFVNARLSGLASTQAVGYWGYANAEPMFHLILRGLDPGTATINASLEVGIEMRAVAPVFGMVSIQRQLRTAEPTLVHTVREPIRPGRVFFGAGVKTYAGTGGFFCAANSSLRSSIGAVRAVGWR